MSAPIVSLATAAAKAGKYPGRFNKREEKMLESVKAYVDGNTVASHKIFAAGTQATSAGSPSQTITVAGALSSDIVMVTLKTAGATPRTVLTASAAAGQINVVMSGDPSTDHVLQYQVIRSA